MIIIPSIDIKDGNCVRLTQGDFSRVSQYPLKPEEVAFRFFEDGASVLHLVDLNGAKFGKISQIDCIKTIRKVFKQVMQVGGGIRDDDDIDTLLNIGVNRVVIGSSAVLNIEITTKWLEKHGSDVIVLALDFRLEDSVPYLAVKGWQKQTQKSLWDVLDIYPAVSRVLCTDINKDGMGNGPNLEFYREIKKRYPNLKVQSSGGISSMEDILKLKELDLDGAIVGKALHDNKLNLREVIACLR